MHLRECAIGLKVPTKYGNETTNHGNVPTWGARWRGLARWRIWSLCYERSLVSDIQKETLKVPGGRGGGGLPRMAIFVGGASGACFLGGGGAALGVGVLGWDLLKRNDGEALEGGAPPG